MQGRTTRVSLPILGRSRDLEIPKLEGDVPLTALLPLARAASRGAMEIAVARAEARGHQIRCQAACGACCRQLVPISVIEARELSRVVDSLPPARRDAVRARFASIVKKMERMGLLAPQTSPGRMMLQSNIEDPGDAWRDVQARYFDAQMPCPFLEDESCSVYEHRPIICREYLVTTPKERCEKLDSGVETIARPLRGSEALATAAREITGEAWPMLPLPLSLEWSEAHAKELDTTTDGENLENHLVAALDTLVG